MSDRPSPLLLVSAVVYLAAALLLLFAPAEVVAFAGGEGSVSVIALLQVLGSALFGFGMLNWMQRYSRIDGIFGRPVVVANVAHTASAALLLGHLAVDGAISPPLLTALAIYSCLAIAFGAKLFGSPRLAGPQEPDVTGRTRSPVRRSGDRG